MPAVLRRRYFFRRSGSNPVRRSTQSRRAASVGQPTRQGAPPRMCSRASLLHLTCGPSRPTSGRGHSCFCTGAIPPRGVIQIQQDHHRRVQPMSTSVPVEDRFFSHVDVRGVCWEWTSAAIKDTDYGVFNLGSGRGTVLAHRWAWEFLVGPIPAGLQIDHQCRNHRCVNPDHFELVTQPVNMSRGNSPSARNARKTACPKCGGPYTVRASEDGKTRRVCRPCRNEYQLARYYRNKGY